MVKLFSHSRAVVIPPAGWNFPYIFRTSLLRVTEYANKFDANIKGLMKDGCTRE